MTQKVQEWESKYHRSRRLNIILAAVAGFLAIVVAAQLMPGQSPTTAAAPQASSTEAAESAEPPASSSADLPFVRRDPEDPMAIGDVDAPVVLTEWVDMRCPFCAMFSRETLPVLIEEYVDTGAVRIEFHDVAFYGEDSENAAIAARAAGEQGMYVEYLTAVYAAAPDGGHPDMPREKLIAFAEEAGIPDMDRFTADLDSPELRDAVRASTESAQQLGVTAVPFFVAGSTAVAGAQPADVFRDLLDKSVAEAE